MVFPVLFNTFSLDLSLKARERNPPVHREWRQNTSRNLKYFYATGPRAGTEPATSGFQVRRPNHSATLPPALRFEIKTVHITSWLSSCWIKLNIFHKTTTNKLSLVCWWRGIKIECKLLEPRETRTTYSCSERKRGNKGEVVFLKYCFGNAGLPAWRKLQTFAIAHFQKEWKTGVRVGAHSVMGSFGGAQV